MGYRITDTREIVATTPGGHQETTYRVFITTDRGATGILEVSAEDWNKETLPGLIEAKVEALDLAFSL